MQAPVIDVYATSLAVSFYQALVGDPAQPVGQALIRARRAAKHCLSAARRNNETPLPEYGVPVRPTDRARRRPLIDTAVAA